MKNLLLIGAIAFTLAGCSSRTPEITFTSAVQIDSLPGECPYLTKDNNGITVLSWIRMINDSTTAFCYATNNGGKSFSVPAIIPNSSNIQPHGENLPKIIFKPSGEIIALWGAANPSPKNKYSGIVFYTQSFDKGKTWNQPRPLVQDTASYDQRYYDVALMPNGEVGVIWLDNRKTTYKEGSGLFFATTQGRNGFGNGHMIAQECCQCCRTDLFIDKAGGVHALYRGIYQDSIRDMVHILSTDGGKTFSAPKRISNDNWVINGCPHTGPAMTENKNGIHFAWFTGGRHRGCFYTQSKDNGKTFGMHDSVSSMGSHPQIASLRNDELVIVWDQSSRAGEKPSKIIALQRRNAEGLNEGTVFLTNMNSFASYPVVSTEGDHAAFVAYTNNIGDKNYVDIQYIMLK